MKFNYWQSLEYDCFYHLYNRSVSDVLLFKNDSDYQFFLNKFKEYCLPFFEIYAFCLIPNHFHFIIKIRSEEYIDQVISKETFVTAQKYTNQEITINDFLANQFKRLFSSYALTYNNKYERKGPLFHNKVKRIFINNDDRLRYLIGYVHHNPIHHNYVNDFISWKFSSFRGLISTKPSVLEKKKVMTLFQGREGFDKFHQEFRLLKNQEIE